MTSEATVTCPKCGSDVKLTESLAAPLIEATRREFQQRLGQQAAAFEKREQAVKAREAELDKARADVDATVDAKE